MKNLIFFGLCALLIIIASSCSDSEDSTPPAIVPDSPGRPFALKVPVNYDVDTPTPLVVLLHGYGSDADEALTYFQMRTAADEFGFLLASPNGATNLSNARYWNATDACCGFNVSSVSDDVAYLTSVINNVETSHNVDSNQIFIIGHSNGGFMAHRMACDLSNKIAAIVSLAGASWNDPSRCVPAEPVSILQVHGDLDDTVFFEGGGNLGNLYPSARNTVTNWATKNNCTGALLDSGINIDLEIDIAGSETRVERFTNCPDNGEVELWTILGGSHVPGFNTDWPVFIWAFLSTHPNT